MRFLARLVVFHEAPCVAKKSFDFHAIVSKIHIINQRVLGYGDVSMCAIYLVKN